MLDYSDRDLVAYKNGSIKKIVSRISNWSEDRIAWFSRLLDLVKEHDFETALKMFEEEFESSGELSNSGPDSPIPVIEVEDNKAEDYDEDFGEEFGEIEFEFSESSEDEEDEGMLVTVDGNVYSVKLVDEVREKVRKRDSLFEEGFLESYDVPDCEFDFDDDVFEYGDTVIKIRDGVNEDLILEIIEKLDELPSDKLGDIRRFVLAWHCYPRFEDAKRVFFNWGKPRKIKKEFIGPLIAEWVEGEVEEDELDEDEEEEDEDGAGYDYDEYWGEFYERKIPEDEGYDLWSEIDWDSFDWDEV